MVILTQVRVTEGKKVVEGFVGGTAKTLEDIYENKKVRDYLDKLPAGKTITVYYVVYGYGDGEMFSAEKDEVRYIERLYKNEPDAFNKIAKQLESGYISDTLKE